ncbi:MAG: GNAT family N-acetyltransferase [Candidatus Hermodarchaeota archaeon]
MDLYFRELDYDDIPQILEITKDIWEGEDYIPNIIEPWLKDTNCMNYGGFKDKAKTQLIGFGRVKIFPSRMAWLQGGRVKVDLQKKGVGKALMKYAIDYAKKVGAKVAQYDTSSENVASLALAKYFGFKEKKSMEILESKSENLIIYEREIKGVNEFSLNKAKEIYKRLNIGPGNEICIGWSFVPLDYLREENSNWFVKDDAILQKIKLKQPSTQEGPISKELWMITYGNELNVKELIEFTLLNEVKAKENEIFVIFCKPEIVEFVKKLGFSYPHWENKPLRVKLFEKILN